MASSPITSWQIDVETMETVTDFIFLSSKITADDVCSHEIKRCLLLGRKSMTNLDSILKSRDITLLTKAHRVKAMAFPVVMYGCEFDHKEVCVPKNWCLWNEVLEERIPLDCKEIKPVNPKGNQPWIFIGRTDAESEAPIFWPPDVKKLTGKDPDDGKVWRQEKKGMMEDEMVRWYHLPNGHEFEQALGDSEGQGSLVCCSPWGSKVSDMTERLSNNNCFYFCLVSSGVLFTTMSHRNKTLNRLHGGSTHCYSSSKAFLYSFINGRTIQISPCFLTLEVCSQCERRV